MKMNFIIIIFQEKDTLIKSRISLWVVFFSIALILAACNQTDEEDAQPGRLKVAATTSLVGDVVRIVGGEEIGLVILLPLGTDPHAYDPTPQDITKISDAEVVFANGAGLEEFLEPLLESAQAQDKVVAVSESLNLKAFDEEQKRGDPHTWTNPNNVMIWVDTIESALSQLDPSSSKNYQANADQYRTELASLDSWIRELTGEVARENRNIVTDHLNFGYFADEYGFTQVGAIIPAYSTMAEPSAQELAELEDKIRILGVKAIFVGNTINSELAERIAEDTGTRLIFVYTGSLSEQGGEADSYIKYMEFNTRAFVDNLK